jgi:hypothetical protein
MHKFTIHGSDAEHDFLAPDLHEGHTLQDAINYAAAWYSRNDYESKPIAWSEPSVNYGGKRTQVALRAEALAAGRVIDLVDGKYVPRGTDSSPAPGTTEGGSIHPDNVDKALHDLLTTVPITDNDKRNAAMLRRDDAQGRKPAWPPERTPFDPFKGFEVVRYRFDQPKTNGREFGGFVLPDTVDSLSRVTGR